MDGTIQSVDDVRRDRGLQRGRVGLEDALEPRFFPEDETHGATAPMGRTIASKVFEMNGIRHPSAAGFVNGVARLVRNLRDPEPASTKRQHLRHEREAFEAPLGIERRKDLHRGPHLDEIADAET